MESGIKCISKGFYKYSQIKNFLSVKNYVFIRQEEKKCLLIRFSNDMGYNIHSLKYTLIQIDRSGKVLDKTKIVRKSLDIAPGAIYTGEQAIVVDEFCSDFKVEIEEVVSGKYRYKVRNGEVVPIFVKKEGKLIEKTANDTLDSNFSVSPRKFGKIGLAVLFAIITVLALIAINVYIMLSKRAYVGYEQVGTTETVYEELCLEEGRHYQNV